MSSKFVLNETKRNTEPPRIVAEDSGQEVRQILQDLRTKR